MILQSRKKILVFLDQLKTKQDALFVKIIIRVKCDLDRCQFKLRASDEVSVQKAKMLTWQDKIAQSIPKPLLVFAGLW